MTDEHIKLIIGSLLHDVGKVIYRQGDDKRKHSISGYDFLREEAGIEDEQILNCVRYHHADAIRSADISVCDPAYITYIADIIASAADRRKNGAEDTGFEMSAPLESVFNILNGNKEKKVYSPGLLNDDGEINYPKDTVTRFDEHFYTKVKANLIDNLRGIDYKNEYINSLLDIMEANLSYVPSSTSKSELMDISLYDHVKLTAAVASCILYYLEAKGIKDYREYLYTNSEAFYSEDAFCIYSMDVSGIQDFIYTISSSNALKTLRARSFYLEIMMEHIIDGLLERLGLSRANLIYVGGGHCYILIPNTETALNTASEYNDEINAWLLSKFKTALYVAAGYSKCSCNSLKNVPNGSYSDIFATLSSMISEKKNNRYTSDTIRMLNKGSAGEHVRECKVCKRTDTELNEENECSVCYAIRQFSKNVLYDDFYVVTLKEEADAVPLPLGCYLIPADDKHLTEMMQNDDNYVRSYCKNRMYTGKHISTKLWVGNHTSGKTFEEMAKDAKGIKRIGVLRADVDNLGHAFVAGFSDPSNDNRYVTLSRTAMLSRHLSLFFKLHINNILDNAVTFIGRDQGSKKRNVTICYSGGDDLFIVGAWNEIIEAAIDIRNCFEKYSQGTLTLSGGIGVYPHAYPISAIAGEVAGMEEESKSIKDKNALTLFEDGYVHEEKNASGNTIKISDGTYKWDEFLTGVLGEKYRILKNFFDRSDERGKNFLYNLLELIRNQDEKINFARYVYILSRLEPSDGATAEEKSDYKDFSKHMYEWIRDEKDCRELKTAMNLYEYLEREAEE